MEIHHVLVNVVIGGGGKAMMIPPPVPQEHSGVVPPATLSCVTGKRSILVKCQMFRRMENELALPRDELNSVKRVKASQQDLFFIDIKTLSLNDVQLVRSTNRRGGRELITVTL